MCAVAYAHADAHAHEVADAHVHDVAYKHADAHAAHDVADAHAHDVAYAHADAHAYDIGDAGAKRNSTGEKLFVRVGKAHVRLVIDTLELETVNKAMQFYPYIRKTSDEVELAFLANKNWQKIWPKNGLKWPKMA